MIKSIRNATCLFLIIAFIFSNSVPVFAVDPYPNNGAARVSNRYSYTTVKGKETLINTTTKTAAQLATESGRRTTIATLAALGGKYAGAAVAVASLVADAHGYGTAARIQVYTRTDTRYRIDSLTGKRVSSSSTHYIIYKLYVKDGNKYVLYKTRECSRHR